MNERNTRRTARIGILILAVLAAITSAGCASGQLRDGARFWGDHAGAAVFGNDPSRD